mgnify:CR=1 FL=1
MAKYRVAQLTLNMEHRPSNEGSWPLPATWETALAKSLFSFEKSYLAKRRRRAEKVFFCPDWSFTWPAYFSSLLAQTDFMDRLCLERSKKSSSPIFLKKIKKRTLPKGQTKNYEKIRNRGRNFVAKDVQKIWGNCDFDFNFFIKKRKWRKLQKIENFERVKEEMWRSRKQNPQASLFVFANVGERWFLTSCFFIKKRKLQKIE